MNSPWSAHFLHDIRFARAACGVARAEARAKVLSAKQQMSRSKTVSREVLVLGAPSNWFGRHGRLQLELFSWCALRPSIRRETPRCTRARIVARQTQVPRK